MGPREAPANTDRTPRLDRCLAERVARVTAAARYLASDASVFTTGSVLVVDRGAMA